MDLQMAPASVQPSLKLQAFVEGISQAANREPFLGEDYFLRGSTGKQPARVGDITARSVGLSSAAMHRCHAKVGRRKSSVDVDRLAERHKRTRLVPVRFT
jgi:hypothetical protein